MANEKLNTGPEENPQPRDATRVEKEEIVYFNLSELFPFKDHPSGGTGRYGNERTRGVSQRKRRTPARAGVPPQGRRP